MSTATAVLAAFAPGQLSVAIAGLLLFCLLIAIGLNLHARTRVGTNGKAALAATFALAAGVPLLVGFILQQLDLFPTPFTFSVPAALVLLVIAEFLAAAALGEMKTFQQRWTRGRKRTVAVLFTPVPIALLIVAGVVAHSSGYPVFGALLRGTAGVTVLDGARNFRLDAPPPWVRTEAARLDPRAALALARSSPAMLAGLIIEPLPEGADDPFQAALARYRTRLNQQPGSLVGEFQPQTENGLRGFRLESTTGTPANRRHAVDYFVQDGRNLYHLRTEGADAERASVEAEARKLSACFRLIDPNPIVKAPPRKVAVTFESPRYGYSVDVTNTVWNREWPSLAREVPFAEFGVLNERGAAAFCVVPVWLGLEEVDLDFLTQAFTARLGLRFTRENATGLRAHRQGPLRGQAFGFERKEGNITLLYRLRVLQGRGFGYLLAAWLNTSMEASPEPLELALNCVTFRENAGEPAIIGERSRSTHSLVWNDLGTCFFLAGKPDLALPWYRRAFDIENANASALINLTEACLQLKRPGDAVALLDQHIGRFPGNQQLVSRRAAAQFASGDIASALRNYASAFGNGLRDDPEFTRYLSVLISQSRIEDALVAFNRYQEGRDPAELKALHDQLLQVARQAGVKPPAAVRPSAR